MSVDTIPLDSTVTVEEDAEPEMIDLDSSGDNDEVTCVDDSAIHGSEKTEHLSTDDVDATNEMTIHSSRDTQSARSNDETLRPAFKVMFRDEKIARQYRRQIREFLHTLVQLEPSQEEDVNQSSLILEIWDKKDNKDSKDQESFMESNSQPNDRIQIDDTCDLLFTIDKRPSVKDNLDIPKYGQKYKGTFEESNSDMSKDLAPKLNCFNCNGNHNMRECPLPKNQANINKNRKEFVAKYSAGIRYHMSEDQRFSHMIPGQLSPKLRKALGLKDNQLPRHIYRMRLLGYPPGWLEEARLQHSGLSLFNSDGMAEVDPNEEEGEIIADVDKDQYDMKKIYDFPGFNVQPPVNTVDDSHKHWVPQMQPMHSKEIMLSYLKSKKADDGYKRKKLKLPPPVMPIPPTPGDMEIEDIEEGPMENVSVNGHFIPPLPKESLLPPPPPPSSSEAFQPATEDSDSQSQELPSVDFTYDVALTRSSPSLSDLENTKKQLLIELEDTSSQFNSGSTSLKNDSNAALVSDVSFPDTVTASQFNCSTTSCESLNTSQDSAKNCLDESFKSDLNTSSFQIATTPTRSAQKSSNEASVKSVHLGTPVLASASPYSKLPSSEKFSKDICDVINFENLPDSTGKYEQMTGVLQKVRSTMARLYQET